MKLVLAYTDQPASFNGACVLSPDSRWFGSLASPTYQVDTYGKMEFCCGWHINEIRSSLSDAGKMDLLAY